MMYSPTNTNDCVIGTVVMVMRLPFSHERVVADSNRYVRASPNGRFLAWREWYFSDEGFEGMYRRFEGL
jgi:hypothetical protein